MVHVHDDRPGAGEPDHRGVSEYAKVVGMVADTAEVARSATRLLATSYGELDHRDFYHLGGSLTQLTAGLEDMCRKLAGQVHRYGDGRQLRDDADADPERRLYSAALGLIDCSVALTRACRAAGDYHAAIGHIAVVEAGEDV